MSRWRGISTLAKHKGKLERVEFSDGDQRLTWETHFSDGKARPVHDELSGVEAAFWRPVE